MSHRIASLANAAVLLYHTMEGLNWAGLYLLENGIPDSGVGPVPGEARLY